METIVLNPDASRPAIPNIRFWNNRTVLITGHTGFKGGWLAVLLHSLGAKVFGLALPPDSSESLYEVASINSVLVESIFEDIRNRQETRAAIERVQPEIVFHLAAQPLVGEAFHSPVETCETNIIGSVNVLDAIRYTPSVIAVVVVTTDKVYLDSPSPRAYRETDQLGGHELYSASKACAEHLSAAYFHAFFGSRSVRPNPIGLATARAGNVFGGGDWAHDRLIPDCVRAASRKMPLSVRNPTHVRPWQHVLNPLMGYVLLAEKLVDSPEVHGSAFNFGPSLEENITVVEFLERLQSVFPINWEIDPSPKPVKETAELRLDSSKAKQVLGWAPLNLDHGIALFAQWTLAYMRGSAMLEVTQQQAQDYLDLLSNGVQR